MKLNERDLIKGATDLTTIKTLIRDEMYNRPSNHVSKVIYDKLKAYYPYHKMYTPIQLVHFFLHDIDPKPYMQTFEIDKHGNRVFNVTSLNIHDLVYRCKVTSIKKEFKNRYIFTLCKFGIDITHPELLEMTNDEVIEYCESFHTSTCRFCGTFLYGRNYYGGGLCGPKCVAGERSKRQLGSNNTVHRMTEETKKITKIKQSKTMKRLINEGKFTPVVTNTWANSRVYHKGINYRSTWELYFSLLNPDLLFEHTRIPYEFDGTTANYLVDFTDVQNKILYEIKPESNLDKPKVIAKETQAKTWCEDNGYQYIFITDDWFKLNCRLDVINEVDNDYSRNKLKRNLKQFYELN